VAVTVPKAPKACAVHRHREWVPIEVHHCWPLGHGEPDIPANRVPLCSNAHGAVHSYLDRLLKADPKPPWAFRRTFGRKVRALAELGLDRIQRQAM
jgi:hypothetical protein